MILQFRGRRVWHRLGGVRRLGLKNRFPIVCVKTLRGSCRVQNDFIHIAALLALAMNVLTGCSFTQPLPVGCFQYFALKHHKVAEPLGSNNAELRATWRMLNEGELNDAVLNAECHSSKNNPQRDCETRKLPLLVRATFCFSQTTDPFMNWLRTLGTCDFYNSCGSHFVGRRQRWYTQ